MAFFSNIFYLKRFLYIFYVLLLAKVFFYLFSDAVAADEGKIKTKLALQAKRFLLATFVI